MKRFTKILLIVSGSLIALGLVFYGISFALTGGKIGFVKLDDGWHYAFGEDISAEYFEVEEFTSVNIDAKYRNIRFIPSDEFGIKANQTGLERSVTDGTLTLKSDYKSSNTKEVVNFSPSLNFGYGIYNYDNNRLDIYYPSGTELKNIAINSVSGSVELDSLTADTVKCITRNSAISIEHSNINSLTLDNEVNALSIEDSTVKDGKINSLNGAIDIDSSTFTNSLDAHNENAIISISNAQINNFTSSNINGMIQLDGNVTGNSSLKTKNSMIEISLEGRREDYNLIINSHNGVFTVDGDPFSSGNYSSTSAPHTLTLETENAMGSLDFD